MNMEKLLNELLGAFLDPKNDVKFEKDDEGNLIIRVNQPKSNIELNKIKEAIENMDDNIFESTAIIFKETQPENFDILQTIDDARPDVNEIKKAFKQFLVVAYDCCTKGIKECADQIQVYKNEREDINNILKNME